MRSVDYTDPPQWEVRCVGRCKCVNRAFKCYDIQSIIAYLWGRDVTQHIVYNSMRQKTYIFSNGDLSHFEVFLREDS